MAENILDAGYFWENKIKNKISSQPRKSLHKHKREKKKTKTILLLNQH